MQISDCQDDCHFMACMTTPTQYLCLHTWSLCVKHVFAPPSSTFIYFCLPHIAVFNGDVSGTHSFLKEVSSDTYSDSLVVLNMTTTKSVTPQANSLNMNCALKIKHYTVNVNIFVGNKLGGKAVACTDEIFAWKYFCAVHITQKYF